MKSKTKFDPKVIQQFFIDHTEKFVVGLVAALFLFFAYQSFMLQKYPKKPEDLAKATNEALAKINNGPSTKNAEQAALANAKQSDTKIAKGPDTKTPENEAKLTLTLYGVKIKELFDTPIKVSDYPMPPRLSWKPIAPRRLRDAPEVFAVEQLRAIPGRGAIPAEKGNAGTIGKRWIVVTGLVPYKKQLAEYRAKFEGAAWNDPREDRPNYLGFFVQRAEVVPAATGEPKWSKFMVFPSGANEAAKMGAWSTAKIVDPRFVRPSLTAPLPLLMDANWGNEAVFPPQIPVLEHETEKDEGAVAPGGPIRRPGHGNVPTVPPQDHIRQPGDGHDVPPSIAPSTDAGGDNLFGGTDVPKPKTEQFTPKDDEAQIPDYLLLRFFDFDVKPNKQYRYRIFLVLKNPNYRLDAMWLEEQELATSQGIGVKDTKPIKNTGGEIIDWPTDPRYAKWSSPCISGHMTSDMRLLCGPVVAAKNTQEINAEVRVLIWQEKSGRNGSFHQPGLIRGTVLNFPEAAVKAPGVARATQVDLTTNCILVDIQGGDSSPRDRTFVSPGMILVMDESGNLVMHDEIAETQEWEKATKEPERQPPPGTRPKPGKRGEKKPPDGTGEIDPGDLEPGRTRPPGRPGGRP